MRRFEFVQGTSAKFWMADVQDSTFIVVFGRLGTPGQRKEKAFPSPDAARRELEKKISEKLREGYQEVSAATSAPAGAKGAAAAAAPIALPPRHDRREPTPARIQAAIDALTALEAARGQRSWALAWRARTARRALEAISGFRPADAPELAAILDKVLARVVAPHAADRLPLTRAMELLYELDASAFTRALDDTWKSPAGPAATAIAVLQRQLAELGDSELTLRVGALLVDRPLRGEPGSFVGWTRRWQALSPHLEAHLARNGSSLKKYLQSLDSSGDPHIARRLENMQAA